MFFLGAVVGYFVAVFAASNILLPLFWAWPKARRLSREGKVVRDIPAARFLAAPLIWTAIVAVLAGIALWLSSGLGSGFVVGFMAGAPYRLAAWCPSPTNTWSRTSWIRTANISRRTAPRTPRQ